MAAKILTLQIHLFKIRVQKLKTSFFSKFSEHSSVNAIYGLGINFFNVKFFLVVVQAGLYRYNTFTNLIICPWYK